MKVGPKYKIGKRLGSSVFEKCQTQKFLLSEERSARTRFRRGRPRSLSNYGRQLLEKQRVRYTYGITERQLSRYAASARTKSGVEVTTRLFQILETRLDNTAYRLGLAATRRAARQMVSHGHIMINGRKTTVPSTALRKGDIVAVRDGSKEKSLFTANLERITEHQVPQWLDLDVKKLSGEVKEMPEWSLGDTAFDLTEVLEFYSK